MKFFSQILLIFLFHFSAHSQSIDLVYKETFGEFNDASAFAVDQYGNFYIADQGGNAVYKYSKDFTLTASFGGFGWNENSFDNPTDIAVSFDLYLYVCDFNNNRVQHLDRNLNYISSIKGNQSAGRKETFGYPKSITIAGDGELFVLEVENKRIIKYDAFRKFIRNFGGLGSGAGEFKNPKKIRSDNNSIYVIDENRLMQYDTFGNFIGIVPVREDVMGMAFLEKNILLAIGEGIICLDSKTGIEKKLTFEDILYGSTKKPDLNKIKDILISGNYLYILTDKNISAFLIKK